MNSSLFDVDSFTRPKLCYCTYSEASELHRPSSVLNLLINTPMLLSADNSLNTICAKTSLFDCDSQQCHPWPKAEFTNDHLRISASPTEQNQTAGITDVNPTNPKHRDLIQPVIAYLAFFNRCSYFHCHFLSSFFATFCCDFVTFLDGFAFFTTSI